MRFGEGKNPLQIIVRQIINYERAKLKYAENPPCTQRRDLLLPNPIRKLTELLDFRALNGLKNLDDVD